VLLLEGIRLLPGAPSRKLGCADWQVLEAAGELLKNREESWRSWNTRDFRIRAGFSAMIGQLPQREFLTL
jgi:hypothetical protein